jgi:hypothetical protein
MVYCTCPACFEQWWDEVEIWWLIDEVIDSILSETKESEESINEPDQGV